MNSIERVGQKMWKSNWTQSKAAACKSDYFLFIRKQISLSLLSLSQTYLFNPIFKCEKLKTYIFEKKGAATNKITLKFFLNTITLKDFLKGINKPKIGQYCSCKTFEKKTKHKKVSEFLHITYCCINNCTMT